jgi:hypothetical protein
MAKPDRDELLHRKEEDGWETVLDDSFVEEEPDAFNEMSEEWGPTPEVSVHYDSPVALFFFFLRKTLWRRIAEESNRYERQTRSARISEHEKNYTAVQHEAYLKKVDKVLPITPHEVRRQHSLEPGRIQPGPGSRPFFYIIQA